ncbi:MAG TPA: hypothetical protein VNW50_18865 [Streptosporangiaceae bacterium]|nr:hypothetical protein [Streptosporangiaceae bacterium]
MIDEFGLGGWWPRPDQAAVGALDHLPAGQWPMLAAKWLAAGFDSPLLRQLAELRAGRHDTGLPAEDGPANWSEPRGLAIAGPSGNAHVRAQFRVALQALDLMPEAMRSIGFDPAPADGEFVARCQSALDVVQHDLDVTGYDRYRMRARFGGGWPATVFATLPDGSYWGGGQGMSREMKGSLLLFNAADSVSATLKEVPEIEWPVCAVHGGHPVSIWDGEEPVDLIDEVAWWRCTNTGHLLAPVGQLTAEIAKTP